MSDRSAGIGTKMDILERIAKSLESISESLAPGSTGQEAGALKRFTEALDQEQIRAMKLGSVHRCRHCGWESVLGGQHE